MKWREEKNRSILQYKTFDFAVIISAIDFTSALVFFLVLPMHFAPHAHDYYLRLNPILPAAVVFFSRFFLFRLWSREVDAREKMARAREEEEEECWRWIRWFTCLYWFVITAFKRTIKGFLFLFASNAEHEPCRHSSPERERQALEAEHGCRSVSFNG